MVGRIAPSNGRALLLPLVTTTIGLVPTRYGNSETAMPVPLGLPGAVWFERLVQKRV